jgi:RNA polymerase sigma factor (sigma-70 family)
VAEAIARLAPKQRVVFCMVHLDGLTQDEVARTLDYSKGYVSKLLKRARASLSSAGWEIDHE